MLESKRRVEEIERGGGGGGGGERCVMLRGIGI
jgi:hypothetical protein